jgi:RHS repeat-associated protein
MRDVGYDDLPTSVVSLGKTNRVPVSVPRTNSSGVTSWYFTNQVGSVIAIASTTAGTEDEITYDPFGNILSQSDSANGDRFMFGGMEYDPTTGLYSDHARYYDAAIGWFVSQDPMGFTAGDTDLYRYVGNEPTIGTNSTGLKDGGYLIQLPLGGRPIPGFVLPLGPSPVFLINPGLRRGQILIGSTPGGIERGNLRVVISDPVISITVKKFPTVNIPRRWISQPVDLRVLD